MQKINKLTLPFRPRARLLQLLGDQLISSPRLAIFELVKNAYDADAEKVKVTLEGIDTNSPSILVEDNGVGMTLDTIKDIWLVPAHDHRELQKKELRRTLLHRLPLGEKGVGRFAVHKLGDKIELVTRAENSLECVLFINWAELIDKEFLSEAEVNIEERTPQVFIGNTTGTKLRISSLREVNLTRSEIRRLQRQITSIASPFENRSDRFEATLHVPEHPDWISDIPDISILLQRAPWYFKFSYENGKFDWTYEFRGISGIKLSPRYLSKDSQSLLIAPERDIDEFGTDRGKSNKSKKIIADSAHAEGIGLITGEFYVFDRDRTILSQFGNSQLVENVLDENGGVRVYRDYIRVYNYGERGDDWLGLDLRRVNTPTRNVSRNIIFGAVDLKLEESSKLKEKTNREGFVENDAYTRFREIVLGALSILEIERKIDKDNIRKLTDKGHDPEVEKISKPLQTLRQVAAKHKISKELDPLIDKVERNYTEMRDTMLRAGLSGMGLAIVFHEIEHGVRVLHDAIVAGGSMELVQIQAKELIRVLDGFTELLRKGEQKENSLKQLLKRARDINRVRFRNHEVKLLCPALEENVPDINQNFAFGLMLGALNNILDNAFYWLQVRWPNKLDSPRQIYLNIEPDFAEGPAIIIADNGPGFQDNPDRITRPFFSRRPDGMGIGLYYTNLVMELSNGRLGFPDADEAKVPPGFDGAVLALIFNKGGKE